MEKYAVQVSNAVIPSNVMQSYHKITHHCVASPHFCKWIEGGGQGGLLL